MRSISVALVLGLLGCGGGGAPSAEDNGVEREGILNGAISGADEGGVVLLVSQDEKRVSRRCTGTLVAKNLVVTARHCVSNFTDGFFGCTTDGELTPGSTAGQMGTLLDAASVAVHTGVQPDVNAEPEAYGALTFAPQTTSICQNDIALVVLDRDLEGLPLSPVRLASGTEPGELVRAVGYGRDEAMKIGTRRTRDGLRIALVGQSAFRPEGGATAPRTFLTEGPALCEGDSGGPTFAESGALVGVFSRMIGPCDALTTRNVFTELAPFSGDQVQPAFEAAGATPLVEAEPGPGAGGETSDGGADGGSALQGAGGSSAGSVGVSGGAGAPLRRGLREPGGCRCGMPGSAGGGGGFFAPLSLSLLAVLAARRRGSATWRGASSEPRARSRRRR